MKAELFPAVKIPGPLLATKSGPGSEQFWLRRVIVRPDQFSCDSSFSRKLLNYNNINCSLFLLTCGGKLHEHVVSYLTCGHFCLLTCPSLLCQFAHPSLFSPSDTEHHCLHPFIVCRGPYTWNVSSKWLTD